MALKVVYEYIGKILCVVFATLWQCDNLDGHFPQTPDDSYDSYSQTAQPWEQVELGRCLDKGLELMGANTHRATAGVLLGCDQYCEVLVTINIL